MNKLTVGISLICLLAISAICQAQSPSDSIYYYRNFWGTKFYLENTRINFNQLPGLMSKNSEINQKLKQAKANKTTSIILSSAGAVLIGWELGIWLVGGDPNWVVAGAGEGLLLISLPFKHKANLSAIQAIDLHNSTILTYKRQPVLYYGMTGHGAGMVMKF